MNYNIEITDELVKEISDTLSRYGDTLVTTIKQLIEDKDKFASGKLYESVQFNVEVSGVLITLQVFSEDYLKYIEQGRTPGSKMPPISSILNWIEIRGIKPRGIPKGNQSLPRLQQSLAFAISKSIARNGIPPRPILKPAVESTQDSLTDQVGKTLAATIKNISLKQIAEAARELGSKVQVQII